MPEADVDFSGRGEGSKDFSSVHNTLPVAKSGHQPLYEGSTRAIELPVQRMDLGWLFSSLKFPVLPWKDRNTEKELQLVNAVISGDNMGT